LFKLNPTVSDIPDRYTVTFRGIKLLVLGAVRKGGGGCACPENVLLRSLLAEIVLNRDEVVIVDMEAGIEHLGRGTARAVDQLVIMVEPGSRSIQTARTIMTLGNEIGLHSFGIVGNKVQSPEQKAWLLEQFPPDLFLGIIPFHGAIRDADIRREPLIDLLDQDLSAAFESVYRRLGAKPYLR
jgi:CO dehydrogenase maturation factor